MAKKYPYLWREFRRVVHSDSKASKRRLVEILTRATEPQLEYVVRESRRIEDIDAVRTAELFLRTRKAMGNNNMHEATNALRRFEEAAIMARESLTGRPLRVSLERSVRQLNRDIEPIFEDMVTQDAEQSLNAHRDTLDETLTPALKAAATGLPIDQQGYVKPAAGPPPKNIKDTGWSLSRILSYASPLLALAGSGSELPGAAAAIVKDEPKDLINVRDKNGLVPWRERIKQIALPVKRTVDILLGVDEDDDAEFQRTVRDIAGLPVVNPVSATVKAREEAKEAKPPGQDKPIGKPKNSRTGRVGLGPKMANNNRHEMSRLYEQAMDRVRNANPIFAGYSLHSVFIETTRPLHASQDGMKFYKDNRPESSLPWSQRIVPPYDYNCLCFTRDIFEDPKSGDEQFVRWEIADHPALNQLEAREVGTWAKWFDLQNDDVKATLIGEERFQAAQDRLGRVEYADIVKTDGRFMSARGIATENYKQRRRRRRAVVRSIERTAKQNRQAFAEGKGQWDLTPFDERKYRKRLEVFANRVD